MPTIVCYNGGCFGDLITALIDTTDAVIDNGTVLHNRSRLCLKEYLNFKNDQEKDNYLNNHNEYKSISSHDIKYHIKKRHSFIGVITEDVNVALQLSKRFLKLKEEVYNVNEIVKFTNINDYAQTILNSSKLIKTFSKRIVTAESILAGTVLFDLEKLTELDINSKNFYNNWLNQQHNGM